MNMDEHNKAVAELPLTSFIRLLEKLYNTNLKDLTYRREQLVHNYQEQLAMGEKRGDVSYWTHTFSREYSKATQDIVVMESLRDRMTHLIAKYGLNEETAPVPIDLWESH